MVSMKDIRAVGRRIAREFRPQRVILFGSTPGARRAGFRHRSAGDRAVQGHRVPPVAQDPQHLDIRLPIDLMAYRPEDVDRRYPRGIR